MSEAKPVIVEKKFEVGEALYRVVYINKEGREYWEGITQVYKIYSYNAYQVLEIFLDNGLCFNKYRVRGSNREDIVKVCVDLAGLEDIFLLNPKEIERINSLKDLQKFIKHVKNFVQDAGIILTEELDPEEQPEPEEDEDEPEDEPNPFLKAFL